MLDWSQGSAAANGEEVEVLGLTEQLKEHSKSTQVLMASRFLIVRVLSTCLNWPFDSLKLFQYSCFQHVHRQRLCAMNSLWQNLVSEVPEPSQEGAEEPGIVHGDGQVMAGD